MIPLKPETVRKLKRFGRMGETYDDLINRLLEERTLEFILPRRPPTPEELEEIRRKGYVSLEEYLKRHGI